MALSGQKLDNYQIRAMAEADLPAVLAVERQCYPSPWSEQQFLRELCNPVATVDLLWLDDELAGYMCTWLIAGELQILNVATSPKFQRRGVADRLFTHLFDRCQKQGVDKAWLEVRAGNVAAITLYHQHGFVADAVRSGYYRDGEDAVLMVRNFDNKRC